MTKQFSSMYFWQKNLHDPYLHFLDLRILYISLYHFLIPGATLRSSCRRAWASCQMKSSSCCTTSCSPYSGRRSRLNSCSVNTAVILPTAWASLVVFCRAVDPDPHSFSLLDPSPNPEGKKFKNNNRRNARKLVIIVNFINPNPRGQVPKRALMF